MTVPIEEHVARAYHAADEAHQGFLYGNRHVIRDLRKPHGLVQEVWSIEEADDSDYDRCHDAMMAELERIAFRAAIAAVRAYDAAQPLSELLNTASTAVQPPGPASIRESERAACEAIARARVCEREHDEWEDGGNAACRWIAESIAARQGKGEVK